MTEDGRDRKDVLTLLAAVSRALDRAGFKIIATGVEQGVSNADPEAGQLDRAELERLFLVLA